METTGKIYSGRTRRQFLQKTGLAIPGLFLLNQTQCIPDKPKNKPNVLLICVDDLNDWIGCMQGHPNTKTPHMDALAARGTLFTNAHCQAPICGPSRASVMTGLLPSTTGIYGHIPDNLIKSDNPTTEKSVFLSNYFQLNGYKTMAKGKVFHMAAPRGAFMEFAGREKGFGPTPDKRWHWDSEYTSTDWGPFPESDDQMPDTRTAVWAVKRLREKHDKPFFMAVGFLRPHVPWHVPQHWFDMHPIETIQTPPYLKADMDDIPKIGKEVAEVSMMPTTEWAIETKQWKDMVQAYLACVSFVDDCVGQVLSALKESAYADNTVILLWGDHGYHLGEKNRFAKMSLWDRSTRAPLIISTPKDAQKQVCNSPVNMLDIYPTLVEACGLPANPNVEGHSLVPLLQNPNSQWPYPALTTYGRNNHSLKSRDYRYIRYEDGSEELYDVHADPNEWHNLANDPKYNAIKKEMQTHLPTQNRHWNVHSEFDANDFLKKQRERDLNE